MNASLSLPRMHLGAAAMAIALTATAVGAALGQAQQPEAAPPMEQAAKLSGPDLVKALRAGGYVLYIRHASTEKDYADQVGAVMGDCSTQRTLSEAGWREARNIGTAIQSLRVPVGPVYSSEYCRAWQTADLAFGRHVALPELNFEPAEEYTPAQLSAMRERVRPLLQAMPEAGYNIAYVAHDDPFEAATGIYPEPQGVTYVVKPGGAEGFTVIGSIAPADWPALLEAAR